MVSSERFRSVMRSWLLLLKIYQNALILILTPIFASIIIPFYDQIGITQKACKCVFMLIIMAVYWCTGVLPLAVTALFPLFFAPVLEIVTAKQISKVYFSDTVVLLFSGLVVAYGIAHTGLHRKIALTFVKLFGTNARWLLLGFMTPTWFLSMWISNTATTTMMASVLGCIIKELDRHFNEIANNISCQTSQETEKNDFVQDKELEVEMETLSNGNERSQDATANTDETVEPEAQSDKRKTLKYWNNMAKALSLSVCYASTCGGMATLTGTGVNIIFYDNLQRIGEMTGQSLGVTFSTFSAFALPLSFLIVIICWIWLQIKFIGFRDKQTAQMRTRIATAVNREYSELGPMNWKQSVSLVHFIALALLWLSRSPGGAGGWKIVFTKGYVTDGTAGMMVVISLFLMPGYNPFRRNNLKRPHQPLVCWDELCRNLNWSVIFLVAGGLALAETVTNSGLSEVIASSLSFFKGWNYWATILVLCLITAGITEFTSNIVVGAVLHPILSKVGLSMGVNPLLIMLPVNTAASFAFMLPVATPPNAIVYGFGKLTVKDMAQTGALLNIIGILLSAIATMTWGDALFGLTTPLNITIIPLNITNSSQALN